MILRVVYLGGLRDLVTGTKHEEVELPGGLQVRDVVQALTARHPGLEDYRSCLRVAVNDELVGEHHPIRPGDELAFLPPVAGGAQDAVPRSEVASRCHLVPEPIDVGRVVRAVLDPGHGAVVTFLGLVRHHNEGRSVVRLEYEAYEAMARRSLVEIVRRCERTVPGARVAVAHRTGTLDVGDVAVVVAAGATHRFEAFEACRRCIELLKEETPIWKRELSPHGSFWIGIRP